MVSSLIRRLCRIIISTEGMIGLMLNVSVLVLLWNRKIRTGWSTYRIGMSITVLHLSMLSALLILPCIAHIFSDDTFTMIFYGPIVYLPRSVSDAAMFMALILTIGIWEFIPSCCLLQFLALCKPYLSDRKRIFLSFTPGVMLVFSSLPQYTIFFAPPSHQPYFDNITRTVHDLSKEDKFYSYGALLFPTHQHKKAVISIVIYVIVPSFSIAFLIFGWCCARIWKALKSFGIKLSAKTISMQRSFLIMLLSQGLLPLVVLSMPVGTFLYAILNGIAMEKRTLVITFSVWAVPIVQGAVALMYVKGMAVSSSRTSQVHSISVKNTVSVEAHRNT